MFAAGIPLAHAGYITVDTGTWRTWQQYGTGNPRFETVQEAFADTQARSPCTDPATQTCVFYENLSTTRRADDSDRPIPSVSLLGCQVG